MTFITIQCPVCRTTDDVPAPALFVDVDADSGLDGAAATVAWVCSRCDALVDVPVEWAPLLAVVSAGAALVEAGETPEAAAAEDLRPAHPENPTAGGRLTPDDLLDFHQGLDSDHWLAELCAPVEQQLGAGPA
jgi:hypothetical protein